MKKVVDLEVKSEKVQILITRIINALLDFKNVSVKIETPSFIIKYSRIYRMDLDGYSTNINNNFITLVSNLSLTNEMNINSSMVLAKVKLNF